MAEIYTAFMTAVSPESLLASIMGVALGIIFGALPGLTPTMGVALLLPLTFTMKTVEAFSMILGMYVAGVYGGCISAILIGTPGTVAAAATILEGPKMTAKGESMRALEMATIASFTGGIFSAVVLIIFAPALAKVAMEFGSPEYFALAFFGLTVVASLTSGAILKGIISCLIGLFIATIGIDPVTGVLRNTFGIPNLFSGVAIVPALIGLFAVSQVMVSVEESLCGVIIKETTESKSKLSFSDLWISKWNFLRSSAIGTIVGIIPATGVSTAAFVAYSEAKRFSKTPELFGTGTLEGIAASESANNAVTGGAMVPLLTLGIPGDTVTAVMLGGLMIQGLAPGPLLFRDFPVVVYGIFIALLIANIFMLIQGLIAIRFARRIVLIPTQILMPVVLTLCAVGGYATNNSVFDLALVAVFGVLGYYMMKNGFPLAPLLLAMILAPIAESNFRRTMMLSGGDPTALVESPIAAGVLLVSLGVLIKTVRDEFIFYKRQAKTSVAA
ncbi:MAG: tripartite tricarboxylate transporter permease [Desulfovibrio sp.]|jgi:putative tricarboxylic transport membrane protein|nr:tripartite tricarboxylate transporter permease [Desulfovibrio sp.]